MLYFDSTPQCGGRCLTSEEKSRDCGLADRVLGVSPKIVGEATFVEIQRIK